MFPSLLTLLLANYGSAISNIEDEYILGLGSKEAAQASSGLLIRKERDYRDRPWHDLNARGEIEPASMLDTRRVMRSLHQEPLRKMRINAEDLRQDAATVPAPVISVPETRDGAATEDDKKICYTKPEWNTPSFTSNLLITLEINTTSSGNFMLVAFRDSINWYLEKGIMEIWAKTQLTDWVNVKNTSLPDMPQTNLSDGQWHKLALEYDGSNIKLYLNGVEIKRTNGASALAVSGPVVASGDILYGCRAVAARTDPLEGFAKNLQIFNQAGIDVAQAQADQQTAPSTGTAAPTASPTGSPSASPTASPTGSPSTAAPSTGTAAPSASGDGTAAPSTGTAAPSTGAPAPSASGNGTAAPSTGTAAPSASGNGTAAPSTGTAAPSASGNGTAAPSGNGTVTSSGDSSTTTTTTAAAPVVVQAATVAPGVQVATGAPAADASTAAPPAEGNFSQNKSTKKTVEEEEEDNSVIIGVAVGGGVIGLILICGCVFMIRRRAAG